MQIRRFVLKHALPFIGIGSVSIMLLASAALATVNTERLRGASENEGVSGFFDGSYSFTQGNTNVSNLGLSLRLQHEKLYPADVFPESTDRDNTSPPLSRDLLFLVGNLKRTSSNGTTILHNGFAHLRWTRMWRPRLGSELFTQYQFDTFRRLRLRQLFGGGTRVLLSGTGATRVYFGTGYMFELERLNLPEGVGDDPRTLHHRWNNYLSVQWGFLKNAVSLINTAYIQPRFNVLEDYRVLDEGEVRFRINNHLSFGVVVSYIFDSRPPSGVRRYDSSISNSLRVDF